MRWIPFFLGIYLAAPSICGAAPESPLVHAARSGDLQDVRRLLKRGTDVNLPGPDGTTALHWAAHRDDLVIADTLVKAGADVKATNRYGVTALSLACTNGSAAMIERLLTAGADPNSGLPEGETALMTAARTGTAAALTALLSRSAEVNAKDAWRGQTALMWAAAEGHREATQVLLAHGADVNARSIGGYTALLFAVRTGRIDVVTLLLSAGALPNDVLPDGSSALTVAIRNAHYELGVVLMDHGADADIDSAGWTPLHLTLMVRNPERLALAPPQPTGKIESLEFIKALLARGADPNARMTKGLRGGGKNSHLDQVGATPFLLAAQAADVQSMRLLLAQGGDPLARTKTNTSALMAAAGLGYDQGRSPGSENEALEAAKLALDLGNDPNLVDDSGNTAMHGAAIRGANSIVTLLVSYGAKLDVKNKKGQTALTLAEEGDGSNSSVNEQPHTAALLRELMR